MNCPNCGDKMERQDTAEAKWDGYAMTGEHFVGADYYCESCTSEYRWKRGEGLVVIYDSYDDASCAVRERCGVPRRDAWYDKD